VAYSFFLPVEEVLGRKVPCGPVVILHEVGQSEGLYKGHQLRNFPVVTAHLVQGLPYALQLGGCLGLYQYDRDPVDQKHHIGPDPVDAVGEGKLVCDMEDVAVDIPEVYETEVALPALGLDEDGL